MHAVNRLILAVAAVVALQGATPALAHGPHAGSQDAMTMLDKAVAEFDAAGPQKALAEFNGAAAPFNNRELYVFVFDLKGNYEAYGAEPKLVGTNAYDLKDAEGKYLVREMIEIARTSGYGKVEYVWLNRQDNRVEHKHSIVRRIGDHIIGVGYYRG